MTKHYLFLSGKPYGEVYHWEKVLFESEQDAYEYCDNYEPAYRNDGDWREDWLWGPGVVIIENLSEDNWPLVWDGNEEVPVSMVKG